MNMTMRAWGGGAMLALATMAGAPAQAAEEDTQAWAILQATRPLGDKAVFTLDLQGRFNEDASRLGQFVFRPSLGWRIDATTTATAGYAYNRSSALGRAPVHEHRAWQQMTYRIAGDGKGPTLTGRTRLEQRFVENRDGTGWRLRQQVRLSAPLQGGVRGVLWTEPFFGLNQTEWGQRDGLAAWRNFAGVTVPLSKTVAIEPGYLNQHVFRPGRDFSAHIASTTLTVQF